MTRGRFRYLNAPSANMSAAVQWNPGELTKRLLQVLVLLVGTSSTEGQDQEWPPWPLPQLATVPHNNWQVNAWRGVDRVHASAVSTTPSPPSRHAVSSGGICGAWQPSGTSVSFISSRSPSRLPIASHQSPVTKGYAPGYGYLLVNYLAMDD